jgi:hypothetical protein
LAKDPPVKLNDFIVFNRRVHNSHKFVIGHLEPANNASKMTGNFNRPRERFPVANGALIVPHPSHAEPDN